MESEQCIAERPVVTEVIREETEKFLKSNEMKIKPTTICGTQQRAC
jgi:hypothetical protein